MKITLVKMPRSKRIFDLIVASGLILLSIPFCLFILIWIIVEWIFIKDSRGPFLYSEKRVSQGIVFWFYKWRIYKMKAITKASAMGAIIHTAELQRNPDNLTYYGRFLKQIYMDEIPQLLNVIKGDMTLVGPRPTNLENSEKFRRRGNLTREIMVCGLTGPFQAAKGYPTNQYELDEEYIKYISSHPWWKILIKDLSILLQTVKTVLAAKGI